MKRLATTVMVSDADGQYVVFSAGTIPPAWAQKAINSDAVWEEGDQGQQEEPLEQEEPVQPGPATEEEDGQEEASSDPDEASSDEDLIGEQKEELPQPSANGSLVDWVAYAKSKGATEELLDGLSRNEIRAAYGSN